MGGVEGGRGGAGDIAVRVEALPAGPLFRHRSRLRRRDTGYHGPACVGPPELAGDGLGRV